MQREHGKDVNHLVGVCLEAAEVCDTVAREEGFEEVAMPSPLLAVGREDACAEERVEHFPELDAFLEVCERRGQHVLDVRGVD